MTSATAPQSDMLMDLAERKAREDEISASRKRNDRPKLLQLVDLRSSKGFMESMMPKDGILADEHSKVKETHEDPDALALATFLNPREEFSSVSDLEDQIAAEGQREPVDVYSFDGEALAFVRTVFPDADTTTEIVVHGERRTRAFRNLKKKFAELAPSEKNPFATIRVRHRGVIRTRIALVETYNDQTGREGLKTRFENAKAMKQYRDAGATLSKIATTFGESIGTVQNRLAIFDLPNNDTFGYLQDAVKNYDLTKAKLARKAATAEDLAALVKFSDKGIRELARSFAWTHVGPWQLKTGKRAESEPANFETLWNEVQARKNTDLPSENGTEDSEPTISVDTVKQLIGKVKAHFRADAMPIAEVVLRVLIGGNEKDLEIFYAPPKN